MKSQVKLDEKINREESKVSMILDSSILGKITALAEKRNMRTQQVIEEALISYLEVINGKDNQEL